MARPKKNAAETSENATETTENENIVTIATEKDLDKAFRDMDDMNPDASLLSESPLSDVDDWISTGSYALNAIISGSVYKGVPAGRVTTFYGLPATGKTLLVNKIIANAQKKTYKRAAYFDSEIALDKAVAERLGCDISKIKHLPVEIIDDCKNQVIKLLTTLIAAGSKKQMVIVIDSLGNLSSAKEFADVEKEKSAQDMGLRAKSLSSLLRMITYRAAKIGAPVLCTNHIYENPNEMYPSLIKKQAGGLKPLFIASLLVQLSTTHVKADDDKTGAMSVMSDRVSGITLRALTAKNRFVPPFISADNIYLNFKTGLSPYRGLLELSEKYALIERDGHAYRMVGGEKIGYASAFEDNAEFWENGPLQELDKRIQKDLTYSNSQYKDLKKELDELDAEEVKAMDAEEKIS
jgi:RecA/RadA recombinase